jgi:uncharacterized protein (DUF305 family)
MKPTNPNPCYKFLSNKDYLIHMIPHHQVAVDVSIDLQKTSKNPVMQTLLRKLIWTQQREIMMMRDLLNNLPENISDNIKMKHAYIYSTIDFNKNAHDPNAECKEEFFDPEKHKKHMSHMHLDEIMYINHMIPHHQVAVDMSKRLLKHSKNDFMISFAYRIIRSQQEEINYMNNLLQYKEGWAWQSPLIN